MAQIDLPSLGTIALALFLAELTDKDAFLLLSAATRSRAVVVFAAGATAFVLTSALFVTAGALLLSFIPVFWVRVVGGVVMVGYGGWELTGAMGARKTEDGPGARGGGGSPLRAFLALTAAIALLDIAGDATEILTIVFVAHYSDPFLVFVGACLGLVSATAAETALGNRLGHLLTPKRVRYGSSAVFLVLGAVIILTAFQGQLH